MVSAVSSERLVNVATPPVTVRTVVPSNGPEPLFKATVTCVVLSPVSRLPYWSSTQITGWVLNGAPAVAVADGSVTSANCVAAAGLITMVLEVATARTGTLEN